MPDISKCCNVKCPIREDCYRYACIPSRFMQSYGGYKPDKTGECTGFWKMLPGEKDEIIKMKKELKEPKK